MLLISPCVLSSKHTQFVLITLPCSPTHMQTFLAESSFSGTDAKNEAGGEPGTKERARDREGEDCQKQLA